jgi:iron-sulfur cluster repair protein YtfE (RIC family)
MKIPIKRLLELANKSQELENKKSKIGREVGKILEKINPDLEEEMRKGYSFLDFTMDYAEGGTNEEQIENDIKSTLDKLKEKKDDN